MNVIQPKLTRATFENPENEYTYIWGELETTVKHCAGMDGSPGCPCPICLIEECVRPLALPCGHVACLECWVQFWDPAQFARLARPLQFSRGCPGASGLCADGRRELWDYRQSRKCVFRCVPYSRAAMWAVPRDLVNPAATLSFRPELGATLALARAGNVHAMVWVADAYINERGTVSDCRRAYFWRARAFVGGHKDIREDMVASLARGTFYWEGFQPGKALSFWIHIGDHWPTGVRTPVFPGLECATHSGTCRGFCACKYVDVA